MFLRWYRKRIAESVASKMDYMYTCPNEREIILNIIAPKDYNRTCTPHCGTDCLNTECEAYCRKNELK